MKTIYLLLLIGILSACTDKSITNKQDYNRYLENSHQSSFIQAQKDLAFWSKRIKTDSMQIISLGKSAGAYNRMFQATGNVSYLKKAEKVLKKAVDMAAIGKHNYLQSLAHNYISQHRFKEAQILLLESIALTGDTEENNFMQFDVAMELGEYESAAYYLEKEVDFSDFNYLTRLAKWKDYKGDLDATIHYMEQARTIAEASNKKLLKTWTYTNLADYYGHAGRIKDSYTHYLKTLELDPANAYAKKGIAWIAYSYERNPQEALYILNAIEKNHKTPDYLLLKAEIAAYQGNPSLENEYLDNYLKAIDNPAYGDMYNTYTAEILVENQNNYDAALSLALKEVKNRPTPETYNLLAYVHNAIGNHKKALKILEQHVINKTFEPTAQYNIASIYKANGITKPIQQIKEELLDASYELGPNTTLEIQAL